MRTLLKLSISVFIVLLLGSSAIAQSVSPMKIELRIEPDRVFVGETFTVTVYIEYTSMEGKVEIPTPEFHNLVEFEKVGMISSTGNQRIVKNPITNTFQAEVIQEFTRTYRAKEAGEFIYPKIEIEIEDPAHPSGNLKTRTPDAKILVLEINAGASGEDAQNEPEEETIRDIKDPLAAPQWVLYVLGLGGGAILLGIAMIISRMIKPTTAEQLRYTPTPPVIVDPYKRAIQKLKDIKQPENIHDDEQVASFYVRVSDIAKEYLGSKHDVMGFEATTFEITSSMRNIYAREDRGVELLLSLEKFLSEVDLAKYAQAHRDSHFMRVAIERAKEFIELDNKVFLPKRDANELDSED